MKAPASFEDLEKNLVKMSDEWTMLVSKLDPKKVEVSYRDYQTGRLRKIKSQHQWTQMQELAKTQGKD